MCYVYVMIKRVVYSTEFLQQHETMPYVKNKMSHFIGWHVLIAKICFDSSESLHAAMV